MAIRRRTPGAEDMPAPPTAPETAPFGDRELDFRFNAGRDNSADKTWQKHRDRRSLFRFKDGTYSKGVSYVNENGVSREEAAIRTVKQWYDITSWGYDTFVEVLLDAPKEPPKPRTDGTVSYLIDHFNEAFISLMQDSPNNPLIRGHLMKKLKVAPEATLDTFDKLKDWIEKTFPVPERRVELAKGPMRTPVMHGPSLAIEFILMDTEHGKAYYNVKRSCLETKTFTTQYMLEIIEEGNGIDGLIRSMKEDMINEEELDMEWDGGAEYFDHDSQDHDSHRCEPVAGIDSMKDRIRQFLSEHSPEALEQMNNNGD